MEWNPDLITPGEIDALKIAASQAWADDTRYPRWSNKNRSYGGGQCYVTSVWLTKRLGGKIGKKAGHFVWLSPDKSYILDLTGNHSGHPVYAKNDGYVSYDLIENGRVKTFTKRADLIFNNLETAIKVASDSLVGDAFPGEEPQRQNDIDSQYLHDEPNRDGLDQETKEYNFFYANGSLEISPTDIFNHDDLAKHLNINDDHQGPMASGNVKVANNKAAWEVFSNIDVKSLSRVFREYTEQVGWDWGGIRDTNGKVVSSSFNPVENLTKLNYVWSKEHLYIGPTSHTVLAMNSSDELICGTIKIAGNKAQISPLYVKTLPQIFEWANDQGFQLYGSSNNLVKRYEDLEQENLGKPDGGDFNPVEGDAEDDTPVNEIVESGILHCPACDRIFPDQHLLDKHRRKEHGGNSERSVEEDGGFPDTDMDKTNPPHFTEQQPLTMPVYGMTEAQRVDGFNKYAKAFKYDDDDMFYVSYLKGSPVGCAVISKEKELKMVYSSLRLSNVARSICQTIEKHHPYMFTHFAHDWEASKMKERGWVNANGKKWVFAAGSEPKDTLEAPIPFVYDIPADKITVGHPGQRTSDIPGKFTPAGIVEGMYEPGGTVNITTMTTMPYSVDHVLTLWYYEYPEFSVKRVNLVDAEGKKTKLANETAL